MTVNQIAQLFDSVYDAIYTTVREVEAALEGVRLVWTRLQADADSPTQIDETGKQCSGYKGQTPPPSRGGSGEPGRSRWEGALGDTLTLVGVCRDILRVIRAERGAKPDELRQTLDEVEILSGKIEEIWHDGWRG